MSLTKQEAFTKAYLGLHAQGFVRSMRPNSGLCAYRGANNCKCAVGHLIPDNLYDSVMDRAGGIPAHHLLVDWPALKPHLTLDIDFEFLRHLQQVHDCHPDPEQTQVGLHRFAAHHGLEVPNVPAK